jgi:hypothetical protein
MTNEFITLIRSNAAAVAMFLCWYILAGFITLLFARKTRVDTWCLAHPKLQFVLNLLRATGLDFWKIFASLKTLADARIAAIIGTVGMLFLLTGCSSMPWAKSAFDEWRSVCSKDLAGRVEVRTEAVMRGVDIGDFAEALCELSDVVAPFMRTPAESRQVTAPGIEAVAAARKLGVVR